MRRVIFQVHMWTGLIASLYICVVFLSGAALLFRIDLQRALDPHLFEVRGQGTVADAADVMDKVAAAYPDHRLAGVEAPTTTRPTYLAYVTTPDSFRTVMIEPVTLDILGELPERTLIVKLRGLHGSLLAGPRGRVVNAIGAAACLLLSLTGLVIWGQRRPVATAARRRPRSGRMRLVNVHRTTGVVAWLFVLMWAATGYSLLFPARARAIVQWFSPLTTTRAPQSATPAVIGSPPPWRAVVDEARRHHEGHVARVVAPANDRAAILVLFAAAVPTPAGPGQLTQIYLDQYSLERLQPSSSATRTAGDVVMAWLTPLHVGGFGGRLVTVIWLVMGLGVPLLAVTGFVLWWTRVVRPGRSGRPKKGPCHENPTRTMQTMRRVGMKRF